MSAPQGNPRPQRPAGASGNGQVARSAGKARPAGKYAPADGAAPPNQSIDQVNQKLGEVRTVMTDNMKKAIDRGEQLEEIEQKSDVLLEDSNRFQTSAAATKQMFCRRHWRNIIVITLLASTVIGLIIWWASSSSN